MIVHRATAILLVLVFAACAADEPSSFRASNSPPLDPIDVEFSSEPTLTLPCKLGKQATQVHKFSHEHSDDGVVGDCDHIESVDLTCVATASPPHRAWQVTDREWISTSCSMPTGSGVRVVACGSWTEWCAVLEDPQGVPVHTEIWCSDGSWGAEEGGGWTEESGGSSEGGFDPDAQERRTWEMLEECRASVD